MHTKVTLRFQRKSGLPPTDDVLRIMDDDEYHDTYQVDFNPGNGRGQYRYFLTRPALLDYIADILRTMPHDADPFEYLQIDTQMHPTVLYHVSDLDDPMVRHLIEDTVETALVRSIRKVKTDLRE